MSASTNNPLALVIEELKTFDPKKVAEYEKAYKGGISALNTKIDEDMAKWRNVPVNIAVTGNSGVGKSSFINSFRGLKAKSEGAAKVGVKETTMEPTKYMHPNNSSIALWDLPGMGTQNFPKNEYLEKVNFEKYDFFLIITAKRFTENDIWLAREVNNRKKIFFFIRTKMNEDVENNKEDFEISKSDTIKEVRKDMIKKFPEDFKDVKVYLIDNRSVQDFDFPTLTETMIKEAPASKQEAMALTLTNLTEDLINRKNSAMRKRIMVVALGSAVGGAIPVPGASLAIDTAIIMKEVEFYKQQFGLNDESLQKTSCSLEQAVEKLKGTLRTGVSTIHLISNFASTLAASECAEKVTTVALPIIGSMIAAGISYSSTVAVLLSILNECVSDAETINKQLMQKMTE